MNKIYKVIWSKAKHTYVVASEIAKGHTKGETTGKGLKKLAAAMLVAAALMSPNFAWAADTKLVEATNGGLSLDNDNVLQKTKTKISSTGEVTTSKEAATTLILNKGAANQVKIDSEGVTVGTSSTQMDAEGFTAGQRGLHRR